MKSLIQNPKTGSRIKEAAQSELLVGRIYNWKFKSALVKAAELYLLGDDLDEKRL
jgi:hypothetical protein